VRASKENRLATKAKAVGKPRGIERRCFKRLVESVDVKQHIAIAENQVRNDVHARNAPIHETDRCQRKAASLSGR